MPIQIIELQPKDWLLLKDIRLLALAKSKESFGANIETEKAKNQIYWQERLQDQNLKFLFAHINDEIVGMLCIKLNTYPYMNHTAELTQVFVKEEWRSRGVFSELIRKASLLANDLNLVKVSLGVFSENTKAIKAYEKNGFKIMGKFQKDFFRDNRFYDTIYMEKII